MRTYERLWWTAVLAALVPAVLLSLLEAPVPVLVVALTMLGLVAGAWLSDPSLLTRSRAPWAAAVALPLAAAPALGAWTLPILGSTVATRWMVRLLSRSAAGRRRPPRRERGCSGLWVDSCLATMSGREICAEWSASYVGVKSACDERERLIQAGVRAGLLGELERRDSKAFARWLERSPAAASEPLWVLAYPPDGRPRRPSSTS